MAHRRHQVAAAGGKGPPEAARQDPASHRSAPEAIPACRGTTRPRTTPSTALSSGLARKRGGEGERGEARWERLSDGLHVAICRGRLCPPRVPEKVSARDGNAESRVGSDCRAARTRQGGLRAMAK